MIDPEEFKERRLQKQQQRQQQHRKFIVKLILAGIFLVACGVLIFVLSHPKTPTPPEQTTPSETQTATQEQTRPEETTIPENENTVIHFAAVGDMNITDNVVSSGGGEGDYSQPFLDIAHLLSDADIAAMNFEGNLCDAPYGNTKSAPQSLAKAISDMGVDMLQLANSYTIHFGMHGLATTINAVHSAGMEPLGVYASQAEFKESKGYTIRNVQGVKIAFVAFTKGMNGLALPAGNENCVNLLYTDYASTYQQINTEGITSILEAAQKEKPDITVAMLHWGSEYNDTVSESQKTIKNLMLENGVDIILGTHSHYLHEMEFNPENGTFVAYSLGDFFGDAQRNGSEYSVVLDLEITKDKETGETKVTNFGYTPIFTVAEKDKPLKVVRIAQAMQAFESGYIDRVSQETYDAMAYALERIEARIQGE